MASVKEKKNKRKDENNKIKKNKSVAKSMNQTEEEMLQEENFSILFIVLILILCFVAGISLGYCLYKIAINSAMIIIN